MGEKRVRFHCAFCLWRPGITFLVSHHKKPPKKGTMEEAWNKQLLCSLVKGERSALHWQKLRQKAWMPKEAESISICSFVYAYLALSYMLPYRLQCTWYLQFGLGYQYAEALRDPWIKPFPICFPLFPMSSFSLSWLKVSILIPLPSLIKNFGCASLPTPSLITLQMACNSFWLPAKSFHSKH